MSHFDKFLVKIDIRKELINKKSRHGFRRGGFFMRGEYRARQTTAPSVSSFSLTGLIRSSRFTPNHIASAAATNTDE